MSVSWAHCGTSNATSSRCIARCSSYSFICTREDRNISIFPYNVSRLTQPITKPYNYKRAAGMKLSAKSLSQYSGESQLGFWAGIMTWQQIAENIDGRASRCGANLIRAYEDASSNMCATCAIDVAQTASASNKRSSDTVISFPMVARITSYFLYGRISNETRLPSSSQAFAPIRVSVYPWIYSSRPSTFPTKFWKALITSDGLAR